MATHKIRYLTERPNKGGIVRYYWQPNTELKRAGWKMQALGSDLSAAIARAQEQNALVDQYRAGRIDGPVDTKTGSVDALIAAYKKSEDFKSLRPRTQKDYGHYLTGIARWAGDQQAIAINARAVQELYRAQKKIAPRKAAYLVQVLRLLFSFAERQSIIPPHSNPAREQKISHTAKKGTLWTREAVDAFVTAADEAGRFEVGTAILLNDWIGQRRGDIETMRWPHYDDGTIAFAQSKTGAEVILPVDMVPHLKERLAQQRERTAGGTIIGLTRAEFRKAFDAVRARVAKDHPAMKDLIFKDLRHTAITRLAEAGCSELEIAAISGHKIQGGAAIIDRYNVRTRQLAERAFQRRIDFETTKQGEQ